ncbi:hypothetical protein HKCCE4037_11550 [Rhodobacterales bacterium HKCCE4037]|nr:hypothetical protein [Rhodobacterales bacterium HKCCE4037]
MTRFLIPAALLACLALPAAAQEFEECQILPGGGASSNVDYNQIGTAACAEFCAATEGCAGWTYTPHNFNPDGAPGECRWVTEVGSVEPPAETASANFCGQVSG